MVQDILWKVDSYSAWQRIACFLYGTGRFITMGHKLAIGLYPELAKSSSTHQSISPWSPS
jgi:hypothetical protein